MYEVNLYIEISTKRFAKCGRHYIYILEYITGNGKVCTVGGKGQEEDISMQRIYPLIVLEAIKRLIKPSQIRIFALCGSILNPVVQNNKKGILLIEEWKESGWVNTAGEPVKNADLWQQVEKQTEKHKFLVDHGQHSYRIWMQSELGKAEKEEKK